MISWSCSRMTWAKAPVWHDVCPKFFRKYKWAMVLAFRTHTPNSPTVGPLGPPSNVRSQWGVWPCVWKRESLSHTRCHTVTHLIPQPLVGRGAVPGAVAMAVAEVRLHFFHFQTLLYCSPRKLACYEMFKCYGDREVGQRGFTSVTRFFNVSYP